MKRRVNPTEEEESATKRNMKSKGKKPYRRPHLIVYGDLSQITGGGSGTKGDGGGTHTRT